MDAFSSQPLTFLDTEDDPVCANTQDVEFGFSEFTLPSQTQNSQFDEHNVTQVIRMFCGI